MDFRILGPLEIRNGDHVVEITAPQQRTLLAALLLRANQALSSEALIDLLWDSDPPKRAKATVQAYVHRLRRTMIGVDRRAAELLCTRASGYLLALPPGALDRQRFEQLVAQGRQALATGQLEEGAALLTRALGLWRGPALADIGAEPLLAQARRLDEERLGVLEERINADLRLGRHAVLVGELTGLVAEHPLRERLAGLLMVALQRCGRQADALAVYAQTRRRLVEDLGIEPGAELQRLQRAILTGELAEDTPPPRSPMAESAPIGGGEGRLVPRQLPADVATFTGRERELTLLRQRVAVAADRARPVVISAIDGMGGIGKSALALHAAHQLAEHFPDGQLYVNLHGATAGLQPLAPLEALTRMLRALGVPPDQVPSQVEDAAACLRSMTAGRRLLVVLDNAADARQVRPLLPGGAACGVLITSRQVMATLDGAHPLHLDVLPPEQAVELLGRIAGPERVAVEPRAAAEVVGWCGYLPLAIRIAGARLAARPSWPVAALAERLADAAGRIQELAVGELAVRASFNVSLHSLEETADPVDRRAVAAFGLLSLPDGPDLGVAAAARLLDQPEPDAQCVLERLVDAQLLETPQPGRYRFHDLVRLYAREHARRHSQPERLAALSRLFGFYTATAWRTLGMLRPADPRLASADPRWAHGGRRFPDASAALSWLEAERANLLAAITQGAGAAPAVPAELPGQLTRALFGFFLLRCYWLDGVQANRLVLDLARRSGDRTAQAHASNDLGGFCERLQRFEEALAYVRDGLALSRQLRDHRGQVTGLANMGVVYIWLGRGEEALACMRESLALSRQLGDRRGQAIGLINLGIAYIRLERHEEALPYLRESLIIERELVDRDIQGTILDNLGVADLRLGRYEEALVHLRESLTIRRELGDSHGQAESLTNLGDTLLQTGQLQHAGAAWQEALAIHEERQMPGADAVRRRISALQKPDAVRTAARP